MAETATRELPQLVGYQEIQDKFGLTRRQLERMQRDGRFPLAMRLTGDGGNKRAWPLDQVMTWYHEQLAGLAKSAVTNPSAIRDENLPDALEALAGRFIALHGEQLTPGDVLSVGVQRPVTDEQRAAIAHNAAAEQRALIEGIVGRLDGLHFVEALILQRAFLPPLRRFADETLKQLGYDISMTDGECREAGLLLVDRLINGETLPAGTHPREVLETLADDGVLARAAKAND